MSAILLSLVLPGAVLGAGTDPKKPAASRFGEKNDSRIIYFEESGGLMNPVSPPTGPGSEKRAPIAPTTPPKTPSAHPGSTPREAQAARPAPAARAATRTPATGAVPARTAKPVPAALPETRVVRRPVSCEQPDEAWSAIEALGREGQGDRARELLDSLAAGCPSDAVRVTALEKARASLDPDTFGRWIEREAARTRNLDAERRFQRLDYARLLDRWAASRAGALERARMLADGAGAYVVTFRDSPVAIEVGRQWLEGGDAASAALWFDRALAWAPGLPEAVRGRANAALAENDHKLALTLADKLPAGDPQRAQIRRDAQLGLAQRASRLERPAEVLELLEAAAKDGPLPRYGQALRGWNLIALGNRRAAQDVFTALYRESPDAESAEGMAAAAHSGEARIDSALASSEPLASLLNKKKAAKAYNDRRFQEAAALEPETYGGIGAAGTPQAWVATAQRDKTGDPGLSQLTVRAANTVDVGATLDKFSMLHFRLDRMHADAGVPAEGQLLGSAPLAVAAPPARQVLAQLWEPRLELRLERELTIRAAVGTSPSGGAVASRPTALLEVAGTNDWGQYTAAATAATVRESVLSISGMTDPYTGEAWGRVIRRGLDARGLWLQQAPWSVGAHMYAARYAGKQVEDNHAWGGDASIGRDVRLEGFAYSAVGFGAGFDRFARNLSHFTVGHGGYFSPQRYARMGPSLDFQTKENDDWMVRGRVAGGWARKREDPSPVLPLAPDGRFYDGSNSGGRDFSVQLSSAIRLTPYVQVGAAIQRSVSPQYRDLQAMLLVRVTFDPRRGVVSADLPVLGL